MERFLSQKSENSTLGVVESNNKKISDNYVVHQQKV